MYNVIKKFVLCHHVVKVMDSWCSYANISSSTLKKKEINYDKFTNCWVIFYLTDAKTTDGDRGSSAQKTLKSDGDKSSVSAFGSITAQLMDGMTLALSQFGATGESKDGMYSCSSYQRQ